MHWPFRSRSFKSFGRSAPVEGPSHSGTLADISQQSKEPTTPSTWNRLPEVPGAKPLNGASLVHAPESRLPFVESAIGKLPEELIIQIITHAVTDALSLAQLSSICSALRNIVISETRLWANIHVIEQTHKTHEWMNRTYEWPHRTHEWVQLCLSRAGTASHIAMHATLNSVRAYEALRDVSKRVEMLDIRVPASGGHGLNYHDYPFRLVCEMDMHPPLLRILRLRGSVITPRGDNMREADEVKRLMSHLIGPELITTSKHTPCLARLIIYGGIVPENLPALPELAHLELNLATISAQALYKMLRGCLKLRSLSLQLSGEVSVAQRDGIIYLQSATTKRLQMPCLMALRIRAPADDANAWMGVLPDPQLQLEIAMSAGESFRPSAPLAGLRPLIFRVRHHASMSVSSSSPPSIDGRLQVFCSRREGTGLLTFGRASDSSPDNRYLSDSLIENDDLNLTPSSFFSVDYNPRVPHSVLDDVRIVQIHIPRIIKGSAAGATIRLRRLEESLRLYCVARLPGLRTLVLRNAVSNEERREVHQNPLFQVLRDRRQAGFPAIALELQRCDGPWQHVTAHLEAAGLVTTAMYS